MPPLYPTHIALNPLQKGAVAMLSAIGAVLSPQRADLVGAVAETTSQWVLPRLLARMKGSEEGRQILEERPRITNEVMERCRDLPSSSFGASYLRFMGDRAFEADDRPPVRFIDNEEQAYLLTRMREVHDFWHVLFDVRTDVTSELALKGLEFVHTGVPMTGLAVLGAQIRLSAEERLKLHRIYLPWAYRAGYASVDLVSTYYERYLQEDLSEVRRKLRIIPAPEGTLTC